MLEDLARNGTYSEMSEALKNTHSPEETADALAVATLRGDKAIVKLLLDSGADPNVRPPNHLPAMHCAVEQRSCDLVRLLANHGADVNVPTETGFTPLHLAVDVEADTAWQKGETPSNELTSLLIELGADPNRADGSGRTPMDIARDYGHTSAMSVLDSAKCQNE